MVAEKEKPMLGLLCGFYWTLLNLNFCKLKIILRREGNDKEGVDIKKIKINGLNYY